MLSSGSSPRPVETGGVQKGPAQNTGHLSYLSVLLLPAGQIAREDSQPSSAPSGHAGGPAPLGADRSPQLHLLERYSLQTREEVEQFITQKTEELQTLEARRTHCRNRLRRCRNPAECDALHTEKDQLTEKICAARKELRTAQKIPPRADWMREKIELLNTQEQQHAACREER